MKVIRVWESRMMTIPDSQTLHSMRRDSYTKKALRNLSRGVLLEYVGGKKEQPTLLSCLQASDHKRCD